MLKSFLNSVRAQPELTKWITGGLIAYHDPASPSYHRSEKAFAGAELVFNQNRGSSAASDLVELYEQLDDTARDRFEHAIADSIKLLAVTDQKKHEVLRDLIEISLDTKNSYAIDAVAQKLLAPDRDLLRVICLDSVYFLEEAHAVPEMLKLGRAILETVDFPYEISARLLVGLCRMDVANAAMYAKSIEPKLKRQLETLRIYETQYEQFRDDFARAVLLVADDSPVIPKLLQSPMYCELLKGKLRDAESEASEGPHCTGLYFEPMPIFEFRRTWFVDLKTLCALAIASLSSRFRRGLRREDTVAVLDEAFS
jgi:hypothetical protein